MDFNFSQKPGEKPLNKYIVDDIIPLVSIITPFYNAGKYFEQTYNCVLNQTFPYFEWIIVNDGSTDLEDINHVQTLISQDKRIKLVHKENGGISTARNMGIKEAVTDIIIPLDADDLIEPTYVECIYWALKCNPGASWAYTDVVGFDNQEYLWRKTFSSAVMKKMNLLTYSAGIRKADLIEVGLYSEIQKHYYEDWYLWLKLLSFKKFPVHIRTYDFWYRRTDGGVLSKIRNEKDLKKVSANLIREIGRHVPSNIKSIDFNGIETTNFKKPEKADWLYKLNFREIKTRILMLIPYMEMGGADAFNLYILSKIDKTKFEIGIITTVPSPNPLKKSFERYSDDIFELPAFLKIEDWSSFIHYFISSRNIDIVFLSNSYYGYYIAPWLRKEFPKLSIIDYVHMEEWSWRAGGYARTSGIAGNILDKTYVCNEHLRKVLINSFGRKPESVVTLYIGVDEDYFSPDLKGVDIRKKYGIDAVSPVVLYPCRISEQKRPFLMIEIAKAARKQINDIRFLVVGDGPLLNEVKHRVKKEHLTETVIIAGKQEEFISFYKACNLTLICSINEGLAMTAYESLAMGVPVISADVGGQSELIDNEVGRLIPKVQDITLEGEIDRREIVLYVSEIVGLLSNKQKYDTICLNCRKKIISGFTKKAMINNLEKGLYSLKDECYSKRIVQITESLNILGDILGDYLTIYNEYEANRIQYMKLEKTTDYIKSVLTFKRSPLSVLRELMGNKNNLYIEAFLNKPGMKLFRKIIYWSKRKGSSGGH